MIKNLRVIYLYSIFVHKLHNTTQNMETIPANMIKEKISAYNLKDRLLAHLAVLVDGGVAETTIYKAYREGGKTPTLRLILTTAENIIEAHEKAATEQLQALQTATA